MPPVELGLFGITAGVRRLPEASTPVPLNPDAPDTQEPTVFARLLIATTEDAAQATEVVAYQWLDWASVVRQQPLRDLMTLEHAEAHGEAPVDVVNFSVGEAAASVWRQMIDAGDLIAFRP